MSIFPKQLHYIGIQTELSTLKIASLKKKGKSSIEVTQLKEIPLNGECGSLLPHNCCIGSALPASSILIRSLETPLVKPREIFASLDYQVESLLPFPVEEAVIQGEILEKKEKATMLTLAIAKKTDLKAHLDLLAKGKLEPDWIGCAPAALAYLSRALPLAQRSGLFIHIGEREVPCALVQGGSLIKGHAIDSSKNLLAEIQKMALAFGSSFDSIYLLGTNDPHMLSQIVQITGKNVFFPSNPFSSITAVEFTRYCLAIGIALGTIYTPQFNFRKGEFVHPHPFKKVKQPLITYMFLMVLLSVTSFALCKTALHNQIKRVEQQHNLLLLKEHKHYPLPLRPSEYHRQLIQMEQDIVQKPDTHTLYPNIPKVHELLGWLTALPSKIELHSFHYTMVKRPTFQQKKEHYQVKVFLEFTTENPSDARSFHEQLLAPNSFVEPTQEVQWTQNREGRYRAVFYLKDKTRYTT